ncbi:MAG: NrfD/PsrC family molybdoenzyme membrane anchor subunit [Ilumatobacteraceae bacterium]
MSVTRQGLRGERPPRDATVGVHSGRPRHERRTGGEQPMVPNATFDSYYGKPILNPPVWKARDIAGYLFTGGLAGGSSLLAAGAHITGRLRLARRLKVGALASIGLSTAALVHDLGVPSRFHHMLRVAKPTSPMSVGSWLLAAYGPSSGAAAVSALTGWFPRAGAVATATAGALGPAVASYTAVLLGNTAVPAWHEPAREMPFVFVASAASAAGGLGLLVAPPDEAAPTRRFAITGAAAELVASQIMKRRVGMVREPFETGRAGHLLRAGEVLTAGGLALSLMGRERRVLSALGGASLVVASAFTRFGIFHAGVQSAEDPKYVVEPQRARARARS